MVNAFVECAKVFYRENIMFKFILYLFLIVVVVSFLFGDEEDSAQATVNTASVKSVNVPVKVSDAQLKMAAAFTSTEEGSVLHALWTNGRILALGMHDDGTKRDGFASYACEMMGDYNVGSDGKMVQIISAQSIQNKDWKVIGSAVCN